MTVNKIKTDNELITEYYDDKNKIIIKNKLFMAIFQYHLNLLTGISLLQYGKMIESSSYS